MTDKLKNDWDTAHNHKPYILEETVTFGKHHKEMLDAMKAPRELSDEEIMKEWHWKYADTYEDVLIEFAKAILKKASEK